MTEPGATLAFPGAVRASPSLRVLDAARPDDRAAWLDLWRGWSGAEVQAHPDYARLFARPCDRVVCVAGEAEAGAGAILFPLVLRPLAAERWARPGEARWDAVTPYGYGGPYLAGATPEAAPGYWRAFHAWCHDSGVVSTFVRLALFPELVAPLPWPSEVRLTNIVVPLGGGPEALWSGYHSQVRRWVRSAERAGLEIEIDRDGRRLEGFLEVYRRTMERHGADPWYHFPRSFFDAIVERLAGYHAFVHALAGGEVVSSDLVLSAGGRAYYFLGGTLESAFPSGANYLVKHHSALWAMQAGARELVLGGGYAAGDTLYRYKRAFARQGEVPFRVATCVHDERGYRELLEDRAADAQRAGSAWVPRPGYFPAYRG